MPQTPLEYISMLCMLWLLHTPVCDAHRYLATYLRILHIAKLVVLMSTDSFLLLETLLQKSCIHPCYYRTKLIVKHLLSLFDCICLYNLVVRIGIANALQLTFVL